MAPIVFMIPKRKPLASGYKSDGLIKIEPEPNADAVQAWSQVSVLVG